jgi:molybdate transport system substrate-binding protein
MLAQPWSALRALRKVHRRRMLQAGMIGAAGAALAACGARSGATATTGTPPATPEPKELVVLAAASLTDVFTEAGRRFPQLPGNAGARVIASFGASSQLRLQLEQGAPADLFASADTAQMELAQKAGVLQGEPVIFASNRLVVLVAKAAPVTSLADLGKTGIKLVTTPKEVPVGAYTRQVLQKLAADPRYGAGFDQRVLANVVSEEPDVRQVVAKVQLGEADAGIVYATDAAAAAAEVRVLDIPDPFNVVATYPIAGVRQARAPQLAQRFIAYLRSPDGQRLLQQYGFGPPV